MLADAIRRAVGIESPVGRTDPISNFWYQPLGGVSSSGIAVTDDVALSVSTLYACIRILSDSIGILPCFVYAQIDEDTKRRAPEHPYYTTLTSRPNNWMTPLEWKSLAVVHLGLRGNFYNRTFAGSPSCAGVANGWTGVDTFNLRIWVCIGGTARYATLF
jgi:hypothetical protein